MPRAEQRTLQGQPNARAAILAAAIDLFAEHGYGGASLQRVAERAGIRKASIFHHFESKADLADEAFEGVRQQLLECLAPLRGNGEPGRHQLIEMIERSIVFCTAHRSSARLGMRLFVDDLAGAAGARRDEPRESYVEIFTVLGQWLSGARHAGLVRPMSVRVAILLVLGTLLIVPATAHDAAADVLGDPWAPATVRAWKREMTAYLLGALGVEQPA